MLSTSIKWRLNYTDETTKKPRKRTVQNVRDSICWKVDKKWTKAFGEQCQRQLK